jgi:hypothetical protein
MAWTNANTTGTTAVEAWADERSQAIVTQADRTTTNSTTGREVTLTTSVTNIDEYEVICGIHGDPGVNTGYLWYQKTTTKFTIYNTGTTTGKELWYRVIKWVEP